MSTPNALVISASGQMRIESVPKKRPQSGEMLVAPLYASICGSDLDLLRGTRLLGTHILGHEGVAEVVAVGSGDIPFAVGQLVTFLPNNPNNLDDTLGVSTEGLFQRSLLIPEAALERGMVVPCDPNIPLICGPLLEPFATVIYGQRLVEQVCRPKSMVVIPRDAQRDVLLCSSSLTGSFNPRAFVLTEVWEYLCPIEAEESRRTLSSQITAEIHLVAQPVGNTDWTLALEMRAAPCHEPNLTQQQYHAHLFPGGAFRGPLRRSLVFSQISPAKDVPVSFVHRWILVLVFPLSLKSIVEMLALEWKEGAVSDSLQPHRQDFYRGASDQSIELLVGLLERPHQHRPPTISAHDFNFGMSSKPFFDTFCFSIWKDINDLMRISIDKHCSIS